MSASGFSVTCARTVPAASRPTIATANKVRFIGQIFSNLQANSFRPWHAKTALFGRKSVAPLKYDSVEPVDKIGLFGLVRAPPLTLQTGFRIKTRPCDLVGNQV